jgi:flagellar biosynthetic protein FliR
MSAASFAAGLLSVGLLWVRLIVAVALAPAFSSFSVPASVRLTLTLVLAIATFAERAPLPLAAEWTTEPTRLVAPVFAEVFTGALLGLGVHLVFGALAIAGRVMDVQVGFALGSVFDPVSRTSSNVLGTLVSLLGVAIFFAAGAHLALIRLVARSIDFLPLGELPALADPMRPVLAAGSMFALGLTVVAPVVVALLLTDLVIAVASRNMPQVNMLVLAMPAKVVVAYVVLAIAVRGWGTQVLGGFERAFTLVGVR